MVIGNSLAQLVFIVMSTLHLTQPYYFGEDVQIEIKTEQFLQLTQLCQADLIWRNIFGVCTFSLTCHKIIRPSEKIILAI